MSECASFTPSMTPGWTYDQFYEELSGLVKKLAKASPALKECIKSKLLHNLEENNAPKDWVTLAKKFFVGKKEGKKGGHLAQEGPKSSNSLGNVSPETSLPPTLNYKGTVLGIDSVGGGGGVSPIEIRRYLSDFMVLTDPDHLEIVFAAAVAHRFHKHQALNWLLLIGPPGGGKTEILESLRHLDFTNQYGEHFVEPLSSVTERTFLSGLDPTETESGDDPSLLARIHDNILLYEEFTTLLQLRAEERAKVFSEFLRLFDGKHEKTFGNGQSKRWTGWVTMIGGVTGLIDHHAKAINALGPRFMFLRPIFPPAREMSQMATSRRKRQREMGNVLWQTQFYAMVNVMFLQLQDWVEPEIPVEFDQVLEFCGEFTATARTPIWQDADGDIDEQMQQEFPVRPQEQFTGLAQGVALIHRHAIVEKSDVARAVRVALDSMSPGRRMLLMKLYLAGKRGNDIGHLRQHSPYSDGQVGQRLQELIQLQLVDKPDGYGSFYFLTDKAVEMLDVLVPMLSPGVFDAIVEGRA